MRAVTLFVALLALLLSTSALSTRAQRSLDDDNDALSGFTEHDVAHVDDAPAPFEFDQLDADVDADADADNVDDDEGAMQFDSVHEAFEYVQESSDSGDNAINDAFERAASAMFSALHGFDADGASVQYDETADDDAVVDAVDGDVDGAGADNFFAQSSAETREQLSQMIAGVRDLGAYALVTPGGNMKASMVVPKELQKRLVLKLAVKWTKPARGKSAVLRSLIFTPDVTSQIKYIHVMGKKAVGLKSVMIDASGKIRVTVKVPLLGEITIPARIIVDKAKNVHIKCWIPFTSRSFKAFRDKGTKSGDGKDSAFPVPLHHWPLQLVDLINIIFEVTKNNAKKEMGSKQGEMLVQYKVEADFFDGAFKVLKNAPSLSAAAHLLASGTIQIKPTGQLIIENLPRSHPQYNKAFNNHLVLTMKPRVQDWLTFSHTVATGSTMSLKIKPDNSASVRLRASYSMRLLAVGSGAHAKFDYKNMHVSVSGALSFLGGGALKYSFTQRKSGVAAAITGALSSDSSVSIKLSTTKFTLGQMRPGAGAGMFDLKSQALNAEIKATMKELSYSGFLGTFKLPRAQLAGNFAIGATALQRTSAGKKGASTNVPLGTLTITVSGSTSASMQLPIGLSAQVASGSKIEFNVIDSKLLTGQTTKLDFEVESDVAVALNLKARNLRYAGAAGKVFVPVANVDGKLRLDAGSADVVDKATTVTSYLPKGSIVVTVGKGAAGAEATLETVFGAKATVGTPSKFEVFISNSRLTAKASTAGSGAHIESEVRMLLACTLKKFSWSAKFGKISLPESYLSSSMSFKASAKTKKVDGMSSAVLKQSGGRGMLMLRVVKPGTIVLNGQKSGNPFLSGRLATPSQFAIDLADVSMSSKKTAGSTAATHAGLFGRGTLGGQIKLQNAELELPLFETNVAGDLELKLADTGFKLSPAADGERYRLDVEHLKFERRSVNWGFCHSGAGTFPCIDTKEDTSCGAKYLVKSRCPGTGTHVLCCTNPKRLISTVGKDSFQPMSQKAETPKISMLDVAVPKDDAGGQRATDLIEETQKQVEQNMRATGGDGSGGGTAAAPKTSLRPRARPTTGGGGAKSAKIDTSGLKKFAVPSTLPKKSTRQASRTYSNCAVQGQKFPCIDVVLDRTCNAHVFSSLCPQGDGFVKCCVDPRRRVGSFFYDQLRRWKANDIVEYDEQLDNADDADVDDSVDADEFASLI